jgi:hypothetical protein
MNEIIVAIPVSLAVVFSIYVYLALRKMVKNTALPAPASTVALIFEKFKKLATLTHAEWIKEASETIQLIESHKDELAATKPEIVTFSSAVRQHANALGISPAPINPARTKEYYRTIGRYLEAYVDAESTGNKAKAIDEMLRLQAFMATH